LVFIKITLVILCVRETMQPYPDVIVLQDIHSSRDALLQELAEQGFGVRGCGGLAGFIHLFHTHPVSLILLAGTLDDSLRNARQVREAAPAAVMIALLPDARQTPRIQIMAAGADGCHALSIDICELTAVLKAWGRHAAPARASVSAEAATWSPLQTRDGWQLRNHGRLLACPEGRMLALTASESLFLARLMGSAGRLVRRQDAAQWVGTSRRSGIAGTPRSIDVLVSRLRSKAKRSGMELPLMAVRGCGYLFVENREPAHPG
jgi:two-component system OmpR family response regulator